LFTRDLTSLETVQFKQRLLLFVANLQLSCSAVEHESLLFFRSLTLSGYQVDDSSVGTSSSWPPTRRLSRP